MRMKLKTCKSCKQKFRPERQMQQVCSYECSIEYAKKHLSTKAKEVKTKQRRALKAFNDSDINKLKRLAQMVFNKYIRLRDGNTCISCGYVGNSRQIHAGHYKPSGGFSALRYNENNVHSQCSICNNHLSANLIPYRENLIKKIGIDEVEKLESTTEPYRYTVEELQEIIKTYRLKTKEKSQSL